MAGLNPSPDGLPGAGSMAAVALGAAVAVIVAGYSVVALADGHHARGVALIVLALCALTGMVSGTRLRRGDRRDLCGAAVFAVTCVVAGVVIGPHHHGLVLALAGLVLGALIVVERGWPPAVARTSENDG